MGQLSGLKAEEMALVKDQRQYDEGGRQFVRSGLLLLWCDRITGSPGFRRPDEIPAVIAVIGPWNEIRRYRLHSARNGPGT